MIVVDSAVLVYCAGGDHPLCQSCRAVIEAAAAGRVEARTTIEVIQEFAWVFAARRPRSDAVARARSFAVILSPLLQTGEGDLEAGLSIFESTSGPSTPCSPPPPSGRTPCSSLPTGGSGRCQACDTSTQCHLPS